MPRIPWWVAIAAIAVALVLEGTVGGTIGLAGAVGALVVVIAQLATEKRPTDRRPW